MPRRTSGMLTPSQNRKSTRLKSDAISWSVNPDKNYEERTSSLNITSLGNNNGDNIFSASALSRKRVRNSTNKTEFDDDDDGDNGVAENEECVSENKYPQRWSYVRESVIVEPKDNAEARFSISDDATYRHDPLITNGNAISDNYSNNNVDVRKSDAFSFGVPYGHNYSHASTINSNPTRNYLETMAPLYVRVGVLPLPFPITSTNKQKQQQQKEQVNVDDTRLQSSKDNEKGLKSVEIKQSWCKSKFSFIERLLRPRRFFQLSSLSPKRRHTRSYDSISVSNSNNTFENTNDADYDAFTVPSVVEDEEQNNIQVLGWSGKYCNVALPLTQLKVPCHALKIINKDGNSNKQQSSMSTDGKNKTIDEGKSTNSSSPAIKTALSITVVLEPLVNNNDDVNDAYNNKI